MDREDLLKLIDDDDFGLLTVKPKANALPTSDERLISSFEEINEFVRENQREPEASRKNMHEMKLHNRLKGFRADQEKIEVLQPHDEFKLLGERKKIESIGDIFEDDDLGLLKETTDIFELRHVPERSMPDYIAKRKPCPDFAQFSPLFKQCHSELANGIRSLSRFTTNEAQINPGDFFVLKGILVYVAEEGAKESTVNGVFNARLRCIFDNGTESDLLLRSLAAALYKDGRRVTAATDKLEKSLKGITDEDLQTGYIYILRSLSDREDVKSRSNLYKIGFCRTEVEERIKNALKEPTYLMAPVSVISAFRCYNLNPQKLENLLHTFFGAACLNIDVFDAEGRRYTPREWFDAPIDVITRAVELLVSEEIVRYRYDAARQEIVRR